MKQNPNGIVRHGSPRRGAKREPVLVQGIAAQKDFRETPKPYKLPFFIYFLEVCVLAPTLA